MYNDYVKIMCGSKYKAKFGTGLKILTPKQILQRLPIALAQVEAVNNSESLLNEIRQFFLCINQKKLLKKYIKMDTTFMNSENSKTFKPHV